MLRVGLLAPHADTPREAVACDPFQEVVPAQVVAHDVGPELDARPVRQLGEDGSGPGSL